MKIKNFLFLSATCLAMAFVLGACGSEEQQTSNDTAIISVDGTTLVEITDKNITSYEIDSNVKIIWENAFRDCASLTEITIPEKVSRIERFAFLDCKSLTEITIPDNVKFIGNDAFSGCSNLKKISIPAHFTTDDINSWSLPKRCRIVRIKNKK